MELLQQILDIATLVLRILLYPIRLLVNNVLFPASEFDGLSDAVTAKAALQFGQYMRRLASGSNATTNSSISSSNSNSNNSLLWCEMGFIAAKQDALDKGALLLIYLHSPLHREAHSYCENVLNSDAMKEWLQNPAVIALGVSIHTAQGSQLAHLLNVNSYPAMALLQPVNASTMHWILKAEGPVLLQWRIDQLLPHLQSALVRHQTVLAEREARRIQREQETALRRQQDEEYQAALEADRQRERELQEQQQREEEERRRIEEEQRQQEEREAAALQAARELVGEEPSSGGGMIRFTLPSGTKLNRRFAADDKIKVLRAYLMVYFHENSIGIKRIGLSTSFPRKTYNEESDDELTLQDAGLCPQAVLMVQDLDA